LLIRDCQLNWKSSCLTLTKFGIGLTVIETRLFQTNWVVHKHYLIAEWKVTRQRSTANSLKVKLQWSICLESTSISQIGRTGQVVHGLISAIGSWSERNQNVRGGKRQRNKWPQNLTWGCEARTSQPRIRVQITNGK